MPTNEEIKNTTGGLLNDIKYMTSAPGFWNLMLGPQMSDYNKQWGQGFDPNTGGYDYGYSMPTYNWWDRGFGSGSYANDPFFNAIAMGQGGQPPADGGGGGFETRGGGLGSAGDGNNQRFMMGMNDTPSQANTPVHGNPSDFGGPPQPGGGGGGGQGDPNWVSPFSVERMWQPLASKMDEITQGEIGKLQTEAGSGGLRFGSDVRNAMANTYRKSGEDKSRLFADLQRQNAQDEFNRSLQTNQLGLQLGQAQDQRDRQMMMDLYGLGGQEQQQANSDLERAFQEYQRQQMGGYDMWGKFLQPGYQSDYSRSPSEAEQMAPYIALLGSVIGAMSDRNVKKDIRPVKPEEALRQVKAQPVKRWRYEWEGQSFEHVGPMAQDTHKATKTGTDRMIDLVSSNGLLTGAIQALSKKVEKLEKKAA